MPSAKSKEFFRIAMKLGFEKESGKGGHTKWFHPDGRFTVIPDHSKEIEGKLFWTILKQLGIDLETFNKLK